MRKDIVVISDRAFNDLLKIPRYLVVKLQKWQMTVELNGLEYAQKVRGYNDEALKGIRKHQRSIRLNRSYRAIYEISDELEVRLIEVQEVNKHKY